MSGPVLPPPAPEKERRGWEERFVAYTSDVRNEHRVWMFWALLNLVFYAFMNNMASAVGAIVFAIFSLGRLHARCPDQPFKEII